MTKKFRPVTAGQRHLILNSTEELTRGIDKATRATPEPEKSLLVKKRSTNGRNHHGHITCRHKGRGHKQAYRLVDFKRNKMDVSAVVERIEYDPNRSAFIALIKYSF